MGKRRVIAETGAGQHGVATATACADFGLQCVVYMGEEDIRRQRPNVFSMKLLGAEVRPVSSGSRTLRDAVNEAFRDWMSSVESTHFCVGSVIGPHPFPRIVRDFQSIIGRETRAQSLEQLGRLPDVVVACVGGGSNAAGMFYPLHRGRRGGTGGRRGRRTVRAAGRSRRHALLRPARRAARGLQLRLQDDDGQTSDVHSVSAGLDYPGTGPEHSYWKETGRVRYTFARDDEILHGLRRLGPFGRHFARPGKFARPVPRPGDCRRAEGRRRGRRLSLRPRRQGRGGDCSPARA